MKYKIECYDKTGVKIVSNLISANGGKFVIEGLAIVTDYSFNKERASVIIGCVGALHPLEDLTDTDLREFENVK